MPIYMKYGVIRGGVTARGYRSWIELESSQYGGSRNSQGGGFGGSHIVDLHVTKRVDVASVALYQECLQGRPATVFVDYVDGGSVYFRLKLHEAMIVSYTHSGNGADAVESLTLNFTKMDFIQNPGVPAR